MNTTKNVKKEKNENAPKAATRISQSTKKKEKELITKANSITKFGGKVFSEDIYEMALKLVTEKHLKELKLSKISGEHLDEMLKAKFIEKNPGSGTSDFRDFQRTAEWPRFVKEHRPENLVNEFLG